MTNESKYLLDVGEADKEHIRHLNENYNSETQAFLLAAGLKPGMRVLDVACGDGIMTRWLTEQVGPEGSVHAIDESTLQLDIAKQNTSGLDNVSLESCSVYALDSITEKFDLVYSRFLLMHLDQPEKAIQQMFGCLNSTGILALVGAIHTALFSEPSCDAYYKFFDFALKMISKNGGDPHWGKKLLPVMKKLGLQIKLAKSFMPIVHTRYEKEFLSFGLKSFEQQFIEDGLSPEELALMYQEFDSFADDENSCFSYTDCIMVAGQC